MTRPVADDRIAVSYEQWDANLDMIETMRVTALFLANRLDNIVEMQTRQGVIEEAHLIAALLREKIVEVHP